MKNVLLSVTVKNLFSEKSVEFVNFHNIKVNGTNLGCSGFVKKCRCDKFVYISTDTHNGKILYRTAGSEKDYTGGFNNFCTKEELADKVMRLL